jgi:hypothetical protein
MPNIDRKEKAFSITDHKGFHLHFPNGLYISVQWGPGNYCDHHVLKPGQHFDDPRRAEYWGSNLAEIAVIGPDGKWMTKEVGQSIGQPQGDDVVGYLDSSEVLAWMVATEKYGKEA